MVAILSNKESSLREYDFLLDNTGSFLFSLRFPISNGNDEGEKPCCSILPDEHISLFQVEIKRLSCWMNFFYLPNIKLFSSFCLRRTVHWRSTAIYRFLLKINKSVQMNRARILPLITVSQRSRAANATWMTLPRWWIRIGKHLDDYVSVNQNPWFVGWARCLDDWSNFLVDWRWYHHPMLLISNTWLKISMLPPSHAVHVITSTNSNAWLRLMHFLCKFDDLSDPFLLIRSTVLPIEESLSPAGGRRALPDVIFLGIAKIFVTVVT